MPFPNSDRLILKGALPRSSLQRRLGSRALSSGTFARWSSGCRHTPPASSARWRRSRPSSTAAAGAGPADAGLTATGPAGTGTPDQSLSPLRRRWLGAEASPARDGGAAMLQALDQKLAAIAGALGVSLPTAAEHRDRAEESKRLKEKLVGALEVESTRRTRHERPPETWAEYVFGICRPDARVGKMGSRCAPPFHTGRPVGRPHRLRATHRGKSASSHPTIHRQRTPYRRRTGAVPNLHRLCKALTRTGPAGSSTPSPASGKVPPAARPLAAAAAAAAKGSC